MPFILPVFVGSLIASLIVFGAYLICKLIIENNTLTDDNEVLQDEVNDLVESQNTDHLLAVEGMKMELAKALATNENLEMELSVVQERADKYLELYEECISASEA